MNLYPDGTCRDGRVGGDGDSDPFVDEHGLPIMEPIEVEDVTLPEESFGPIDVENAVTSA